MFSTQQAVEALGARRDPDDRRRWIYHADETRSYWSITEQALVDLTDRMNELDTADWHEALDRVYTDWAEADNTAIERGNSARYRS